MKDLQTQLTAILTDTFAVPADEIDRDATFESLGLDSLDLVELVLIIEEETGVRIPDEELEHVRTVGAAIDAVASRAGAAA